MAWAESNREYLASEVRRVAAALAGTAEGAPAAAAPVPLPALLVLQRALRLSPFERDVIVMCAGAVLEPGLAALGRPTFGRALAALPGAHLDATAPGAPLRAHRLVTLGPSEHVLSAVLALDERIFHFLLGVDAIDERIAPLQIPRAAGANVLVPSHVLLAERLARVLHDVRAPAIIQLFGGQAAARTAILSAAAASSGLTLLGLRAAALATTASELDTLVRACDRESLLTGALPVLELDVLDPPEVHRTVRAFADIMRGMVVISAADPVAITRGCAAQLELPALTGADRRLLWRATLGDDAERIGATLDRLADQFRIDHAEITAAVHACDRGPELGSQLWTSCLERSRPRLDDLARRIVPIATWDDLVVPPAVAATLREIGNHLRHRHEVHDRWGFARGEQRGHAITALFAGPSGTGKTLAAEIIARDAELDLYHVDLSQVVDKYVGETEKRLRRIFDAAEQGGAILLFDEADALFGKRGDVERGTDRWANLEVSYLLQRMESYHGLAILTTNAKDALDNAFLRRLRFVARFPFPDHQLRLELWRRAFPVAAPTRGLDLARLARLQLTGANIKSVALNAAFHAAVDASPIELHHVLRAARSEYAKLEVPFPEAEARGWTVDRGGRA